MILALLLSLAPVVTQADDRPPLVRVQLNHEQFRRGDRARVYVETAQDVHLLVLHADPDGRVRVLFPLDPTDDDFFRAGKRREIEGRSGRDAVFVDGEDGTGTLLAAASADPFRYDGFVRNGHWDYRALGGTSLRDDPLAGLLDLVQRMAGEGARFEYDVASYVVGRQIASRHGYGHSYGHRYGVRFGLSFGSPYGYGYYYDPFYDPFCYDPFWGWSGLRSACYPYRFGYSSIYFGRPYVYGRTFSGGGFVSRNGGSRFVMPRDRVRVTPIEPRRRAESVSTGSRVRSVEPRARAPRRPAVTPRGREGGRSPSVSRGSVRGSRPAARPSGSRGGGVGGGRGRGRP
ncbi:MAG TPA: DUF4384 domain-containing protein [Gemmatimonadales bacterium]